MNIVKSYDFFRPEDCTEKLHIIGCGAVGSTVAENLCRFGLTKFVLWDFDTVEPHNIANQMFRSVDIGKPKVEALKGILTEINPDIETDIKLKPEGYKGGNLSGYVFLCVDNIDIRRQIVEEHKLNTNIEAMFDFRMGLLEGQHYAANWRDSSAVENMLSTMNFTHEEAQANAPVSACNMTLSVVPTVRSLCSVGVANFINFVKTKEYKSMVLSNPFGYDLIGVGG